MGVIALIANKDCLAVNSGKLRGHYKLAEYLNYDFRTSGTSIKF